MACDDLDFDVFNFSGIARLFPLPNLVLFPHVMQPLHIFEPRYRAMMEEAIAGDQFIALAMLAPGWENQYEGRPPLLPMACLGRVATYQRLPDNRFNLLLLGLKRIKIKRELPPDKPFREAEVEICEDIYPADTAAARASLHQQLVASFKRVIPASGEAPEQVHELLGGNIALGVLTDIVGYSLDLDMALKVQLLQECNVDRRAALLLEFIQQSEKPTVRRSGFPPEFSVN